jgi:non-canonical (house-cleaning) NTP pyrophosphatase
MIIALGSANPIKLEAVREAIAALGLSTEIVAIDAPSGVNAQPVGEETLVGARHRAAEALRLCPQATHALGIENGLFSEDGVWHDAAMVVLLTPKGQETSFHSPSVIVPNDCVEEARIRGFATTTVGTVIAERFGGNPSDPHTTLTGGKTNRKDLLITALKELLLASL